MKTLSQVILLLVALSFTSAYAVSASFKKRDDVITAQVQDVISKSDLVKNAAVTVTTENSIVKITGKVKDSNQAQTLVTLANSIAGVEGVDINDLTYGGEKLTSDDSITGQLTGIFMREGLMGVNSNKGT
ncbi:MAG TPA: BON domain-containing protein, partial [Gammaproteobacteria bacterium]|nr:BON domain-containing protein [Gammaproteobacteria bacterium]